MQLRTTAPSSASLARFSHRPAMSLGFGIRRESGALGTFSGFQPIFIGPRSHDKSPESPRSKVRRWKVTARSGAMLVVVPGLQSTDWLPHEITRCTEQYDECYDRDQVFHDQSTRSPQMSCRRGRVTATPLPAVAFVAILFSCSWRRSVTHSRRDGGSLRVGEARGHEVQARVPVHARA
jgi:hypothetical protein